LGCVLLVLLFLLTPRLGSITLLLLYQRGNFAFLGEFFFLSSPLVLRLLSRLERLVFELLFALFFIKFPMLLDWIASKHRESAEKRQAIGWCIYKRWL